MGGDAQTVSALVGFATLVTLAGTVGFARFYGFSLTFPMFAWVQIRGLPRVAISLGLSLPTIGAAYATIQQTGMPPVHIWLLLVVKEMGVGALLGILLGLPFWAIQGAGDAMDVYRGASAANLMDPVNAQETTISGTFFGLMTMAFFLSMDGFSHLLDLLLRSHGIWPLMSLSPPFEVERLKVFADVAVQGVMLAVVVAAPLFTTMLLVDTALVFSVRGARSFHIYDLSLAGRGFMFLLVMPVFVVMFANQFSSHSRALLKAARDGLDTLLR